MRWYVFSRRTKDDRGGRIKAVVGGVGKNVRYYLCENPPVLAGLLTDMGCQRMLSYLCIIVLTSIYGISAAIRPHIVIFIADDLVSTIINLVIIFAKHVEHSNSEHLNHI